MRAQLCSSCHLNDAHRDTGKCDPCLRKEAEVRRQLAVKDPLDGPLFDPEEAGEIGESR